MLTGAAESLYQSPISYAEYLVVQFPVMGYPGRPGFLYRYRAGARRNAVGDGPGAANGRRAEPAPAGAARLRVVEGDRLSPLKLAVTGKPRLEIRLFPSELDHVVQEGRERGKPQACPACDIAQFARRRIDFEPIAPAGKCDDARAGNHEQPAADAVAEEQPAERLGQNGADAQGLDGGVRRTRRSAAELQPPTMISPGWALAANPASRLSRQCLACSLTGR